MNLGQHTSLIVVLVLFLYVFVFSWFWKKKGGGCGWWSKIFDSLFTSKFISFFVLKKEEQVYVCGDFSALFACNIKDGVTLAIWMTPFSQQDDLNDILLGLVMVLIVLNWLDFYFSVIVVVFMGFKWRVIDNGRTILLMSLLSIIVQVILVVAVIDSRLRSVWLVIFVVVVLSFK